MESNYPIQVRSNSYKLKISNPRILGDIQKLGIVPNKSKVLLYPTIPKEYIFHFIRGFLDGDGWVVTRVRKNGSKEICIGFCNGSYNFMRGLVSSLNTVIGLNRFNLRRREKITKKGKKTCWYQLEFYSRDAYNLLTSLYGSLGKEDLFLKRKYNKFLEARDFFKEQEESNFFGRKGVRLKKRFNEDIEKVIIRLLNDDLLPREIALKLEISLSTLYRWFDKYKIRIFAKRGSEEWLKRIIKSRSVSCR